MIPYVVRAGDYLSRLAHRMGFDAKEVWEHAANRDLRARRDNPEMLAPGDILHVPPREPRAPLALRVGASNRYRVHVPTTRVRLAVGRGASRLANAPFRFELPGEAGAGGDPVVIAEGTSDGEGFVEAELPIEASIVLLVFPDAGIDYRVRVGHLDPIDEEAGLRSRLRHLGYLVPAGVAPGGHDLRLGLRAFQHDHGLTITGALDNDTRRAILEEHGS